MRENTKARKNEQFYDNISMGGYAELVYAKQFPAQPPVDCTLLFTPFLRLHIKKKYHFYCYIQWGETKCA